MDAIEALKRAHTDLGYNEFCAYLGLRPDDYSFRLFVNLRQACEALGAFDDKNLAKLIAYRRPEPHPA